MLFYLTSALDHVLLFMLLRLQLALWFVKIMVDLDLGYVFSHCNIITLRETYHNATVIRNHCLTPAPTGMVSIK